MIIASIVFVISAAILPFQTIIPVIIAIAIAFKIDQKKLWLADQYHLIVIGVVVTIVVSVIFWGIFLKVPYTKEENISTISILSLKVLPNSNGVINYVYFYPSDKKGGAEAEIIKDNATILEKSNRSEIITYQEYSIRNFPWYLKVLFLKDGWKNLENKQIEIYTNQSLSSI
ncbi:MAG: hypothetical protein WCX74_01985 [Candidatus Paceibacterota bacterium]